ncbi:hypothetical protein [Singulisphaera acidiphila]|uniref:Uncharacterized protein n=1 Tax=Singulisphaera acidiphila (strain ATCC BAA-1392 / DSM 18658 / VKM B-2454 / MOB10) TaxID=886293 RepID=L0DRM4_SINAD|nr:hypothetical protein [Singulisphaera acidiphila]AGA31668.1 hypothetical protein Sinac_7638 [Singulisphaera acidiphila DSM 18658]
MTTNADCEPIPSDREGQLRRSKIAFTAWADAMIRRDFVEAGRQIKLLRLCRVSVCPLQQRAAT